MAHRAIHNEVKMLKSKFLPAAAIAGITAMLLAGCTTTTTTGAGSSDAASSSKISAEMGSKFSGGKGGAAKTSSSPITIGMINQEGGTVSDPEGSVAVQAAFDYINKEQGGIGGHPLKLVLCKIASSEEEAQQCAQQFLNNSDIDVVMQGGLNVGADAVHQVLNGAKPDIVTQGNPGPDQTAANTFVINPSALASLPGLAYFSKTKGLKKMAIVVASDPGNVAIAGVATKILSGSGINATTTTFPSGSTDLTATYTSVSLAKPDAIVPIVTTTAGCIASAQALKTVANTAPVIASNLCATEQIKQALGDFPKWNFGSTTLSLYAPDSTGQVAFYKAVMAKYAGANPQLAINAPASFGAAFLVAKILNGIGASKITADSVSSAFKAYTGAVLLGTPQVAFGSVSGSPTLSGIADRYYTYQGAGKWTTTGWINLSNVKTHF
jgi:branched-chain amino acid transport system substrate-binding protein